MAAGTFQDILPFVQTPSRYLGEETNRIRKTGSGIALRFALAFPDLYEIGMSHFGIQILYQILNAESDIAAERVFMPAADMAGRLAADGIPLVSLETNRPLGQFDVVGFSLLYELNITNVLSMLDLAGIPLRAAGRDDRHPLVIAGGPCVCNPEPYASFFDAMVIGDGEHTVLDVADAVKKWKRSGTFDRTSLLRRLSEIPAVYVPAFYEARYDESGFPVLHPAPGVIRPGIVADLDRISPPAEPVVPFGKPIHDRLRLEIARGCTRGCRFCQAGILYRPVRERNPKGLMDTARRALAATGYEDLSLLSLSAGDYCAMDPLLTRLMRRLTPKHIAVSLPSLRADTLTPALMREIKRVRKTGFTIAPEAGSRRMRDRINKNITEARIRETVENAFTAGWQLIKLYFMIGFPGETSDDRGEIVRLAKELSAVKGPSQRKGKINISLATFIPKPHTPFQWEAQADSDTARRWIEEIKSAVGDGRIHVKWQNPRTSFIEGAIGRGDRRMAEVIEAAYRRGRRYDGWSDSFCYAEWIDAFADAGVDPAFYTTRRREETEPLPWDHIRYVTRDFLREENRRAREYRSTPDCRFGECKGCGICDEPGIRPIIFPETGFFTTDEDDDSEEPPREFKRINVTYEKIEAARFFGHLEMVTLFLRAFRRAGIPLKHSGGFHPMPKVGFSNPLPVGMESEAETLYAWVPGGMSLDDFCDKLNRQLPPGLRCKAVRAEGKSEAKDRETNGNRAAYKIYLPPTVSTKPQLRRFHEQSVFSFTKTNRKGKKTEFDLKTAVKTLFITPDGVLHMHIETPPGAHLRPDDVLQAVLNVDEQTIRKIRIRKKHDTGTFFVDSDLSSKTGALLKIEPS